jgi:DnaJ-class molecular chaperone
MTRAEALALLGLPEGADQAAIDRCFRALAKRHHPDAAPGDPGAAARFARLVAARDRLRDPTPDPASPSSPASRSAPSSPTGVRTGADAGSVLRIRAEDLFEGGTVPAWAETPCTACGGSGWRRFRLLPVPLPCPTCEGRGMARAQLRLRIPPGLAPDALVEAGGALYRLAVVLPDGLNRQGANLIVHRTLRPGAFRRGTCVVCPLPWERIRIRVPPGTAPGTTLRIPARGLPNGRGGRGDLLLRLCRKT